jgi:hypothetical protein
VLKRRKKGIGPKKYFFKLCHYFRKEAAADGLSSFCADGCLHSIPFRTKPPKIEQQQGCQIFFGPKYQNGGKYTKLPQYIPNGYKIFLMAVK